MIPFMEFVQTEWPVVFLSLMIILGVATFVYAFGKEMQR
jgi:hypothetical protein